VDHADAEARRAASRAAAPATAAAAPEAAPAASSAAAVGVAIRPAARVDTAVHAARETDVGVRAARALRFAERKVREALNDEVIGLPFGDCAMSSATRSLDAMTSAEALVYLRNSRRDGDMRFASLYLRM